MKRVAVLLGVGIAAACSTNLGVVATVGGGNTCTADGECARYKQGGGLTCVGGRCMASGNARGLARLQSPPYPYTLAIAVPDTGAYAPGTTLVLPSAKLLLGGPVVPPRNQPCTGDATENTCVAATSLVTSQGLYETDPDMSSKVGRHLSDQLHTTLPVHTTFTLLTSDAQSTTSQLSTGIPILPVYASVIDQVPFDSPLFGPGSTPPIAWTASLPAGRYRRDIVVDAPFNDAFPPWSDVVSVPPSTFSAVDLQAQASLASQNFFAPIDDQSKRTFSVPSLGSVDLRGWHVYLIWTATEMLASSIATLTDAAGGTVVLNTVSPPLLPTSGTRGDLTGRSLVIAPPPGVPYPSVVYSQPGGSIASNQDYPGMTPPALVSGVVARDLRGSGDASLNASPVAATIYFSSVPATLSAIGDPNRPLVYRTSVRAAADGTYSVLLPRGDYEVAVVPDPASGLAVFYGSNLGDAGGDQTLQVLDDTLGTNDHAVQPGHGFSVTEPATITGTVTTTDGRPLGGVTVAARPSVGRVAPGVPAELASLARTRQTTADANGVFTLGVDPGVYDLFAEAPFSSGFAWGVSPAHAIVAAGATLPVRVDISVPAPVDASMRLYDPNTIPLRGALVQAFAPVNPSDPNSPQIEIGEGRTDSSGGLQLLLPPQLPQ